MYTDTNINKLLSLCQQKDSQNSELYDALNDLNTTEIKLLDLFLRMNNRYKSIYPTRKWVGGQVGVTERHITRLTNKLSQMGIISKILRDHTSCIYFISEQILTPQVRKSLSFLFKAFQLIPLYLLSSSVPLYNNTVYGDPAGDVTLLSYIKDTSYITSVGVGVSSNESYTRNSNVGHPNTPHQIKKRWKVSEAQKYKILEEYRAGIVKSNPVSQVVMAIKLPLSSYGRLKLAIFPDEAITFALGIVKKNYTTPKDLYKFIFNTAHDYCKTNSIFPLWSWFYQMCEILKFSKDTPVLKQSTPNQSPYAQAPGDKPLKQEGRMYDSFEKPQPRRYPTTDELTLKWYDKVRAMGYDPSGHTYGEVYRFATGYAGIYDRPFEKLENNSNLT